MGLFDLFGRNDPDPAEGQRDEPRCHHYTLAHYALRSVAFENPLAFLGVLASPDGQPFLADILRSVTEHCNEREPGPDFRIEDITIHKVRVGQYPCAILQMPPPRATTEVYFVGAVLLADLDDGMPDASEVALRYFTLEHGFVLGGPPRTVLCEWTAGGSHCNYGDGPEPLLESFVGAMQELLSRSQ